MFSPERYPSPPASPPILQAQIGLPLVLTDSAAVFVVGRRPLTSMLDSPCQPLERSWRVLAPKVPRSSGRSDSPYSACSDSIKLPPLAVLLTVSRSKPC